MRGIRMLVLSSQEYSHMVGFDLRITDYVFSWQGFKEPTPLISRMVKGFLVNITVPYLLNSFVGVDVKTPTQLTGSGIFATLHRANMVELKGKYFLTFDREADKVLLVEYVPE